VGFDTLIGQNSQVKIQSLGESFRSFVKTQSVFEKALYWLREGEQGNEIRNCLYKYHTRADRVCK